MPAGPPLALPELRAWERIERVTALVYAGLALLVCVLVQSHSSGAARRCS